VGVVWGRGIGLNINMNYMHIHIHIHTYKPMNIYIYIHLYLYTYISLSITVVGHIFRWASFAADESVFVEDEGAHVGRCGVPVGLWERMRAENADVLRLEVRPIDVYTYIHTYR